MAFIERNIPAIRGWLAGHARALRADPHRTMAGVVVIALAICGGVWLWSQLRAPAAVVQPENPIVLEQPKPTKPRWIDGTPIPVDAVQSAVTAIVIDNAPEARPQSGIIAAPLVFEFPVEGQRTRFIAVYHVDDLVETIGPVRSARPYFVGLAEALDAPLVHVGGSNAALALLQSRRHINQYYDPPFWRSRSRLAPFNVYTALSDLAAFFEAREWSMVRQDDSQPLWNFDEEQEVEGDAASRIALDYGLERAYDIEWQYDSEHGQYTRFQGGRVHRDVDGAAVIAKNVVVLRVPSIVLDRIGRLAIPPFDPPFTMDEPLEALVFTAGRRVTTTWRWQEEGSRFGINVPLRPGATWVEVVNFDIPQAAADE